MKAGGDSGTGTVGWVMLSERVLSVRLAGMEMG